MSEDNKFQRFGKYLILDHLVDGGMAKICRARYLGEQANKVVAINMVQPQFSNDEAFVRMFQDELNITFGMLHPNIMQVYDYGKINGQLYTAMEYIHGANLKQFLDRLKENKYVFPVEISCYIISQVCLGLHYAHTFTDKLTGKPYNIVHRDISPHNIMLTYDGAVKVIDFGIAKANTNSEATQAGTIKGKLSYLAPEYLDGLELDARYDEFAVGITLWELLCSRKLFQAANDLAVLKQIQQCKIAPPSSINPQVPKELDAIVLKALSKDRSQRYENLDQLNRALVRFLYSQYPDFNPSDLTSFAADLFSKEIAQDKKKFVEYGQLNVDKYIADMKNDERTSKIAKKDIGAKEELKPRQKVREIDLDVDSSQVAGIQIERKKADGTTTSRLNKTTHIGNKTTAKGTTLSSKVKTKEKTTRSRTTRRGTKGTQVEDEATKSKNSLIMIIFAASFAAFSYIQPDLVEEFTGFNLRKLIHGDESGRVISSVPKNAAKAPVAQEVTKMGKIVLSGADVSMEVHIDGKRANYNGSSVEVPLNQTVSLMVKKSGHAPFIKEVTLTTEKDSEVVSVPALVRARVGLLTSSQNYAAGSKLVYTENGIEVQKDLPFKDAFIPEGKYQAKIINPILGTEKKVEFSIEENKKHFLE